jgi:hypothetical protein
MNPVPSTEVQEGPRTGDLSAEGFSADTISKIAPAANWRPEESLIRLAS